MFRSPLRRSAGAAYISKMDWRAICAAGASYVKDVGWFWFAFLGLVVTVVADLLGETWVGLTYPWAIALSVVAPFAAYIKVWGREQAALGKLQDKPIVSVSVDTGKNDEHGRPLFTLVIKNAGGADARFRARVERIGEGHVTHKGRLLQEELYWDRGGFGESHLAVGEKDVIQLFCSQTLNHQHGEIITTPHHIYFMNLDDGTGRRVESYVDQKGVAKHDDDGNLERITMHDTWLRVMITAIPTPLSPWEMLVRLSKTGWVIEEVPDPPRLSGPRR